MIPNKEEQQIIHGQRQATSALMQGLPVCRDCEVLLRARYSSPSGSSVLAPLRIFGLVLYALSRKHVCRLGLGLFNSRKMCTFAAIRDAVGRHTGFLFSFPV